ncbi:type IV secretion system DNA-binding domain-containing protein, partial [bacterium]|nr:type IV secretion system DNA-binding domain-containing protein [bacterium]
MIRLLLSNFIRAITFIIGSPKPIYAFFSGRPVWWGELIAAGMALWFVGQILRYLWQGSIADALIVLVGIFLIVLPLILSVQQFLLNAPAWLKPLGWAPAWGGFIGKSIVGMGAGVGESNVKRGAEVVDARTIEEAAAPLIVKIGRVQINPKVEPQHFLITGTTGAGKTQAIHGMLDTIRRREQPVIVADVGGVYLSKWANGDSFILNPFDARDAGWNPFVEIKREYDCDRLAKAAIPDAEGESQQWNFYAQNLFSAVLTQLWKRDQWSPRELVRLVMSAETSELAEWVKGTAAAPLASESNERMLASTRSIASL